MTLTGKREEVHAHRVLDGENSESATTFSLAAAMTSALTVRLLSIMSTSFEKRLVMRPKGVVSKKDIGARSTRVMARFIITLLAVVPNIVRKMAKKNMRRACTTPRPV